MTPIPTPFRQNWADASEAEQNHNEVDDGMRDRAADLVEADDDHTIGDSSYEEAERQVDEQQGFHEHKVTNQGGTRAPTRLFRQTEPTTRGPTTPRNGTTQHYPMHSPISGVYQRSRSRDRGDRSEEDQ